MRRIVIVGGATFVLVLTIVVSSLLASDGARGQTTVGVEVGDFWFCDSSFQGGVCETNITAGDTVTWTWVGISPHTVTSCDTGFINCTPAGEFYSNILTNGATFSHTFTTAGSFDYRCDLHSTEMRGRVNVAAAQATPTPPGGGTTTAATPTGGAGQTAPAGAASTRTAASAAIPGTGGAPTDGGVTWPLILTIAGGAFVMASALAGAAIMRRSAD